MKSGSKIHFLSDATRQQHQRGQGALRNGDGVDDLPRPPGPPGRNTIQDSSSSSSPPSGEAAAPTRPGSAYLDPTEDDEELTVELSGLRVHAPWPGLHGACEGCGAPSVSGLGSGPTECEHCHRQIAGGEGGGRQKPPARGGKGSAVVTATRELRAGKEGVVAVTSSREIALGDHRAKVLAWTGAAMLATSSLLLLLVLIAW